MSKKPIVITVANQKGGVGKTTTVANLASSLASLGHLVLVIDCDYQANVTSLLCGDEQLVDKKKSITQAIKHDLTIKDVVVGSKIKNVDVVPSNRELDDLREQLVGQPNQFKLVELMLDCTEAKKYDFVLIDTHPSLDCFFQSSITASQHYIIPLFPEADSSRGLAHQLQVVEKNKRYLNPKLNFLGCLVVKFDKYNATHQKFEKLIREYAKEANIDVFKNSIPNSTSVAAASAYGLPVFHYKKTSPVGKAYLSLSREILTKMKKLADNTAKIKNIDNEMEVAQDL